MGNTIVLKDKDGNVVYPVTDVSLVMGLEEGAITEAIVAWDGSSTPVVANIPAGVVVSYNGTSYTGTLAASASTAGVIYMVATGSNNVYDRYLTSGVSGSYAWTNVGNTTIDLSTYATKAELNQLSQEVFTIGNNIFNYVTALQNTGIQSSDGVTVVQNGYMTSDWIRVKPSTNYTFKGRWVVVWFDKEKNFVSSSPGSQAQTFTLTSPATAKYMRFSFATSSYNPTAMMVNEGSSLLPFEPYVVMFNPAYLNIPDLQLVKDRVDKIEEFDEGLLKIGPNLFNVATALDGYSISSTNGEVVNSTSYMASDWIPVNPSTYYSFKGRYVVAWYAGDKTFISSSPGTDAQIYTLISPAAAKWMRFSFAPSSYNPTTMMVNEGSTGLSFMPYKVTIDPALTVGVIENISRSLEITNIKMAGTGFNDPKNLCLITAKTIYEEGKSPDYTVFLFLDIAEQKLYISNNTPDNPVYLCDWDDSLSGGENCEYWLATITKDNDIIFLRDHQRRNPIIYPHTDYQSPYIVDFGDSTAPYGALMSQSVVQFNDGSFVFGDYAYHSLEDEQNNNPRNIWRVVPPYNVKSNWVVAHRFKHVAVSSPVSDEPDNEIGHIHAIQYDWYNDVTYCTTGDIDRHCRLWYSLDRGETWQAVPGAVGWVSGDPGTGNSQTSGQKWRFTGMIFTKDVVYWATDSFNQYHALYKVVRGNDGVIDADTLTLVKYLEINTPANVTQATYIVSLMRSPYGLLIIDRAEPRTDGKLNIKFYDIENDLLSVVYTLDVATTDVTSLEQSGRIGLPNQFGSQYQPETLPYSLIGGGTFIRPNNTAVFNNSLTNYVGALKLMVK